MIKLYLGGIGSGKSISIVKEIVDADSVFFTNFKIYNTRNYKRLKTSDIILVEKEEKKLKHKVNWGFWREQLHKYHNFNIAIDELHNLMHARRAMSKFNVLMSTWIAQIRKICGSSEKTHFYSISQELERIDISVRDLANIIIFCKSIKLNRHIPTLVRDNGRLTKKLLPMTYIIKYYFLGTSCTKKYIYFRDFNKKTYDYRTKFLANDYFKYYDSYELIDFGEGDWL